MKHYPVQQAFVEGRGYSQKDWDEVSDHPEWTKEELQQARSFKEGFPDLYASAQKAKIKPKPRTKLHLAPAE